MGLRGVNPKRWFYGFNAHLARDPEHTARVLCGPAAERWLAAEMYGYLASELPESLTCYGEDGTTDLTVYRTVENARAEMDGVWDGGRVASIEFKVLYRTYSEASTRARVAKLCEQIRDGGSHGSAMNVGYVFGVFVQWPTTRPRARETFERFRRDVGTWVRTACEGSDMACAKPTLETVIDARSVLVGGVAVEFGLVAQYILPTERPVQPRSPLFASPRR